MYFYWQSLRLNTNWCTVFLLAIASTKHKLVYCISTGNRFYSTQIGLLYFYLQSLLLNTNWCTVFLLEIASTKHKLVYCISTGNRFYSTQIGVLYFYWQSLLLNKLVYCLSTARHSIPMSHSEPFSHLRCGNGSQTYLNLYICI